LVAAAPAMGVFRIRLGIQGEPPMLLSVPNG
jgi:hypothetical protein